MLIADHTLSSPCEIEVCGRWNLVDVLMIVFSLLALVLNTSGVAVLRLVRVFRVRCSNRARRESALAGDGAGFRAGPKTPIRTYCRWPETGELDRTLAERCPGSRIRNLLQTVGRSASLAPRALVGKHAARARASADQRR